MHENSYELKEAWISSSVFPFVSGTTFATNTTVAAQNPAYIVNVPVKKKNYKKK